MFTYRITFSLTRDNQTENFTFEKQASGRVELDETIPAASTNLQCNFTADVSAMVALMIVSDQDVTIKTNSTSTPGDTIPLKANVPIPWVSDFGSKPPNPLTADVTTIYVNNAGAVPARLRIYNLQDATP